MRWAGFDSSYDTWQSSNSLEHLEVFETYINKPFDTAAVFLIQNAKCPKDHIEALNGENKTKWLDAMQKEMKSFENHKCYTIQPRNGTLRTLKGHWIFTLKTNQIDNSTIFKARYVLKGCAQ